jgi:hypothetical protein
MQGLAAAGRPVGLGEYGMNPLRLAERLERRNGELRRAGETQPQRRKRFVQGSKSGRGSAPRRSAMVAARGSLLTLFFQPPADELALELGQIVDE